MLGHEPGTYFRGAAIDGMAGAGNLAQGMAARAVDSPGSIDLPGYPAAAGSELEGFSGTGLILARWFCVEPAFRIQDYPGHDDGPANRNWGAIEPSDMGLGLPSAKQAHFVLPL